MELADFRSLVLGVVHRIMTDIGQRTEKFKVPRNFSQGAGSLLDPVFVHVKEYKMCEPWLTEETILTHNKTDRFKACYGVAVTTVEERYPIDLFEIIETSKSILFKYAGNTYPIYSYPSREVDPMVLLKLISEAVEISPLSKTLR